MCKICFFVSFFQRKPPIGEENAHVLGYRMIDAVLGVNVVSLAVR